MKITISGDLGSGKSTLGKRIAADWGYKFYSTGDIFRKLSQERGLDVVAGNQAGEKDRSLDDAVDAYSTNIGKEEDNFIFDSRLAWHFIPDSYSIYFYCRPQIAATRIYAAAREDEQRESVEEMLKANEARRKSELKRYQSLYNINLIDLTHYDLVLDTSRGTPEELTPYLEEAIKSKKRGIYLSPDSLCDKNGREIGPKATRKILHATSLKTHFIDNQFNVIESVYDENKKTSWDGFRVKVIA